MDSIKLEIQTDVPPSVERAVDILRRALQLYPLLRAAFLSDDSETRKKARKDGVFLCRYIENEIRQNCEFTGLSVEAFERKMLDFLGFEEIRAYQEASEWLNAHHQELFAPAPRKSLLSRKAANISRRI